MSLLREYIREALLAEKNRDYEGRSDKYPEGSIGWGLTLISNERQNAHSNALLKKMVKNLGKTAVGAIPGGAALSLLWDAAEFAWKNAEDATAEDETVERAADEYPILQAFVIDPDVWDVLDDHEVVKEWMPEYLEILKTLDPMASWDTIPPINDFIAKKVKEVSRDKVTVQAGL